MIQKTQSLLHYCQAEDFGAYVRQRMEQSGGAEGRLALLTLDFDNFNYVNDLFSYETGDLVLARMTEHFSRMLEEGEIFTHTHADHFVFCLQVSDDKSVKARVQRIADFADLFDGILPAHYWLACSGGFIYVTDQTENLSSLLDKANFARKKAKGINENTFLFYDKEMGQEIEWKKIVTVTMEAALRNREFEMYLQPKILIKSGRIVGAEALARWNSPEHGLIFPDRFIPIMEQNGFVRQLDFFILEEACRFIRGLADSGIPPVPVSVNFSRLHMRTENFVDKVQKIVELVGIPAGFIEIEFTESLLSEDFNRLASVIQDLKRLGFKVSLDDFGSAYSTLNCLKDLPLDVVKIDKAFLNPSANTEKGRVIISKIVDLLKSLNYVSVMEGVESEEQVDFLKGLSCDMGQGYHYAKPMPVCEYLELMEKEMGGEGTQMRGMAPWQRTGPGEKKYSPGSHLRGSSTKIEESEKAGRPGNSR